MLKNKVIIVTGASSGIGKSIADSCVLQGAYVVYSDIHKVWTDLPENRAEYVSCDVSQYDQVKQLIEYTYSKHGKIDGMVNNAGIGKVGGILETDIKTWNDVIGVNLSGVFYGTQLVAQKMKEKGTQGSIVNMSSILGSVGLVGAVAYCASKGGVVQLTRASALDLAPSHIRVNAIAPGFIETQMTKDFQENKELLDMVEKNTPLGHMGKPEDIASLAVFLLSDQSAYITGQVHFVDGGWTAR